jgi:hypothetical protein
VRPDHARASRSRLQRGQRRPGLVAGHERVGDRLVQRQPLREPALERLAVARERATAAGGALPGAVGVDLQQHDGVVAQRLADAFTEHRAAAQRDNLGRAVEQLADHALLDLAERGLSLAVEERLDRGPQIGLDERVAVSAGERARGRRLARAHEADQDEGHGRMKPIRSS